MCNIIVEDFINIAYKMECKMSKYDSMINLSNYKKDYVQDQYQSLVEVLGKQKGERKELENLAESVEKELQQIVNLKRTELEKLEELQARIREAEQEEEELDQKLKSSKERNNAILGDLDKGHGRHMMADVEREVLEEKITKKKEEVKELINDLQDIKGSIRVNIRIKPSLPSEKLKPEEIDMIEALDDTRLVLRMPKAVCLL